VEDPAQGSAGTSEQGASKTLQEVIKKGVDLQKSAKAKRAKAARKNDRNKENETLNRDTLQASALSIRRQVQGFWKD